MGKRNGNGEQSLIEQAVMEEARRIVVPFIEGVEKSLQRLQMKFHLAPSVGPRNGGTATHAPRRKANGKATPASTATPKVGELVTYKVGRGTFTGKVTAVDIEKNTAEIEREGGKPATRDFGSLSAA